MNIAAVLAIASSSAEVLKLAVELIKTATREGRDITPAELEALRHRRGAYVVQSWSVRVHAWLSCLQGTRKRLRQPVLN